VAYNSVDFARQRGSKERYQATLPAYELPAESAPYEVEYYFEVADAAQRRLAGRGDPFNPLIFLVAPQKAANPSAVASSRPWYKSPWVWVAVGAAVVGGTAAGVALASSEQRGRVPVTIRVNPSSP
jgi:hypothetical protein